MMRLDYDALVQAYHDNLESRLRGFSSGLDFLELFVPDEDPVRGVDSLLEAARSAGLAQITIALGPSAAFVDRARLSDLAAEYGSARLRDVPGGLELELSFEARAPVRGSHAARARSSVRAPRLEHPRVAASPEELAPAYHEAALTLAREARYESELGAVPDGIALTALHDELCLSASVARADHRIVAAAHRGAPSALTRGVLECACREIIGRPILEAAEHGALRVELSLRGAGRAAPSAGVVLPEHGGRALAAVSALLAGLLDAYRERTGYAAHDSDYWPAPGASWVALDDDARLAAIDAVLRERWPGGELCVSAVSQLTRVLLSVAPELPIHERQRALLAAEMDLRRRLEPTLVVEREARRDLSPIRRL